MPDGFITTACERCNRGFNVANPLVQLDGPCAICPHCGQKTTVDAESMEKAKAARGLSS